MGKHTYELLVGYTDSFLEESEASPSLEDSDLEQISLNLGSVDNTNGYVVVPVTPGFFEFVCSHLFSQANEPLVLPQETASSKRLRVRKEVLIKCHKLWGVALGKEKIRLLVLSKKLADELKNSLELEGVMSSL